MIAVVGAGLGGLAAAVTLARAGREVTVFEAGHEPGGFATTFTRGPYTFEASLHAADAAGPGEPNAELFERLGIAARLDLVPLTHPRRELWVDEGLALDVPGPREDLIARLAERFPGCEAGAREVFALAERAHGEVYAALHQRRPRLSGELRGLLSQTTLELLRAHVPQAPAARALASLTTYLGLGPEDLAALPYLVILHGYHGLTPAWPRGGSRAFTEALVAELEARGGRLRFDAPVRAIRLRRRAVEAVVAGEDELPVQAVVSAISPQVTFGELIPEAELPGRLLRRVQEMQPSGSLYSLQLGVRDLDGLPPHTYESFLHGVSHPALPWGRVSVTARHLIEPGWAPEGHGVLELASGAPRLGQAGVEGVRDALVEVVERHLLPGLSERVEVEALAHPGTYHRYTRVPGGSTFGFAMTPTQAGPRGLQAETAIEGLALAGAWVSPGPGQTAAMLSGEAAGLALLGG